MNPKNTTFEGEIVTKIESKTLASGKFSQSFSIRTKKGELINCVIWSSYIDDSCNPIILDKGKVIIVKGFWGINKETNSPTGDLILKWFGETSTKETKKHCYNDNVIKYCGGRAKYEQMRTELEAINEAKGIVKVPDGRWLPKRYCVQHNGTWKDRMDYLCDVLGCAYVNEKMSKISEQFKIGINITKGKQVKTDELSGYEQSVIELLKEASNKITNPTPEDNRLPEDYNDCPF